MVSYRQKIHFVKIAHLGPVQLRRPRGGQRRRHCAGGERRGGGEQAAAHRLVERFDIEPFPDCSAK